MAYTKTNWVNNGTPPLSAANLNNIENGIYNCDNAINHLATYSTTETPVGTWTDGRVIYRKVLNNVPFGTASTATAMGISNLSKVLKVEGMLNEHPINFYVNFSGTAYFSSCWVYGNDLYTICSASYAGNTDVVIEYIKTS